MASFNVEINPKPNKHGFHTVFVRITVARKLKRFKTSVAIPLEHFNAKGKYGRWVRTINPRQAKLNHQIDEFIQQLKLRVEKIEEKGLPVLVEMNKPYINEGVTTVKMHLDSVLEEMKVEKAYIYYNGAKSMFSRFQNFVGDNTPLNVIDTDHIQRFKIHLISTKISNVTINNILKRIHAAFISAVRSNLIERDPFRAHDTLPELPSKKQRLNDEQIQKLEELELRTDKKINWPYHTRNMYLFSYYNAGIRVADLMQLRHGNITSDGRLEYEMSKTGHQKSIALNKKAKDILAIYSNPDAKPTDYLFPVLDNTAEYAKYLTYADKKKMGFHLRELLQTAISGKTSQINNNLKVLSAQIGLDKSITFHTARHSFADKARRSMKKSDKITMYDIKNALGHKSILTTERYMNSFDKESLDEAMSDIFE
ncbi:tyrosine-type recombinase/integrase [Dyadobacter bucti]|uniref:tyrosine-type recombinase/integrase n=1 Tax=Dyadobacter bucti TaxID=2572203 RepID=UPI001109B3D5|nr:tyrosine-type recombinase/integrase [Dyadobacter bucti]